MSQVPPLPPVPPAPAADPAAVTVELQDVTEAGGLRRLCDLLPGLLDEAEAAHEAATTGKPRGPISGLSKLDKALSGCFVPGLHVLTANTGAGKTALALQMAADCGTAALFVTTEMGPNELCRRLIANRTGTYLGRLKSGEFTRDAFAAKAAEAFAAVPHLALFDATRRYCEASAIQDAAEAWRQDCGGGPIFVVLDSLHAWATASPDFRWGEYETLGAAVVSLQRLAATLDAPVLLLSESNRSSAEVGGVNAGAGSRKIEFGAETVLGLYRETEKPKDYGTTNSTAPWRSKPRPKPFDAAGEVRTDLVIEKNRHGAGRVIELRFHGARQAFREV